MEQHRDETLQQIAENSKGTIVFLKGKIIGLTIQIGSGFFVEPDKIATNIHVIEQVQKVQVITAKQFKIERTPICYRISKAVNDAILQLFGGFLKKGLTQKPNQPRIGRETAVYTVKGVTAFDDKNDLVLLKIAETGVSLPFGNSDDLQSGEPVYAVGYDGKKYKSIAGNIISGRNRNKQFQIKARISPKDVDGHSGGPVLNSKGEVIGVVVSGVETGSSEGDAGTHCFINAVPLTVLKALMTKSGRVETLMEWQKRPQIRAYGEKYLGDTKLEAAKYKEAIESYDAALRRNPSLISAYFNRGNAKDELGDFEGAIEDYNNAIRLNPEHVSAYFNRGVAKSNLSDFEGAMEDYNNAIRLNSEDADAYNNRGNVKDDLGDSKGAIKDYDNAIRLNPEDADIYYNRGLAKKALGQQEAAKADFQEAKRLNPDIEK